MRAPGQRTQFKISSSTSKPLNSSLPSGKSRVGCASFGGIERSKGEVEYSIQSSCLVKHKLEGNAIFLKDNGLSNVTLARNQRIGALLL